MHYSGSITLGDNIAFVMIILNTIIIKDSFPMPTIDELLDEVFFASYFSKLDLRSGYHQVLIHIAGRYKIAFRNHHGHLQWWVMSF